MTEERGETRLSDQIAYHRSLCDAAGQMWVPHHRKGAGASLGVSTPGRVPAHPLSQRMEEQ